MPRRATPAKATPARAPAQSLAALPAVAAEWHATLNGDLRMGDVSVFSNVPAWWQCPRDATHVWRSTSGYHTRVHRRHGTGCRACIRAADLAANSVAARTPALAAEWHPTRNGSLRPDLVRAKSEVSVWWQCCLNPAHAWQRSPQVRARAEAGCPWCRERKRPPPPAGTSLADLCPEIASQWHPTANAPLTPAAVVPGTHKRVTWVCPADASHLWQATVKNRTGAHTGCPMCSGRRVTPETSLLACNPEVAREWHPSLNGTLGPADVRRASSCKVWWQCSRDPLHTWRACVANRTRSGRGCPACAGQVVTPSTSLLTCFPRVAAEWHPTKNGALAPSDVRAGSDKKVWWRCHGASPHEWKAKVFSRTKKLNPTGCAACSGRIPTPTTSLAARAPTTAKEWHPTKNRYLQPDEVTPGSQRRVWWQCPRDPTHAWKAVISSRTGPSKSGCPFCSNRRLSATNSLAVRFPAVAAEWHPTKNGRLRPERVIAGTNRKAWWQCRKTPAHVWQAVVCTRAFGGSGCPACANKVATADNCFATKQPELARQWHPSRNGTLTPAEVTPGSDKKVWWRCHLNPADEWDAQVYRRCKGAGCPQCSRDSRQRPSLRGTERAAPDPALRAGPRTLARVIGLALVDAPFRGADGDSHRVRVSGGRLRSPDPAGARAALPRSVRSAGRRDHGAVVASKTTAVDLLRLEYTVRRNRFPSSLARGACCICRRGARPLTRTGLVSRVTFQVR